MQLQCLIPEPLTVVVTSPSPSLALQTLTCFCTGLWPEAFTKTINHGGPRMGKSEVSRSAHAFYSAHGLLRLPRGLFSLIAHARNQGVFPAVSREPISRGPGLKPHPPTPPASPCPLWREPRVRESRESARAALAGSALFRAANRGGDAGARARSLEFNGRVEAHLPVPT